jgi:hypothetical protein
MLRYDLSGGHIGGVGDMTALTEYWSGVDWRERMEPVRFVSVRSDGGMGNGDGNAGGY